MADLREKSYLTEVHECPDRLPKSGSGKVMWRALQEAPTRGG
jgi:hypothetical protein